MLTLPSLLNTRLMLLLSRSLQANKLLLNRCVQVNELRACRQVLLCARLGVRCYIHTLLMLQAGHLGCCHGTSLLVLQAGLLVRCHLANKVGLLLHAWLRVCIWTKKLLLLYNRPGARHHVTRLGGCCEANILSRLWSHLHHIMLTDLQWGRLELHTSIDLLLQLKAKTI